MSDRATTSAIARSSTVDGARDPYDHAIQLVDTTKPGDTAREAGNNVEERTWRGLARNVTKTSVRDSINRRKYAKWSAQRFDTEGGSNAQAEAVNVDADLEAERSSSIQSERRPDLEPRDSQALDFAPHITGDAQEEQGQGQAQEQGAQPEQPEDIAQPKQKKTGKAGRKDRKEREFAIDILYENQRGWFFCGIPLYSHSSLLQFDPAAWVTKDYKASAVNITNAQVPDPSWQWEWKHWYVDMTDDVDEDGWQYSFAFFGRFSWHGSHPWFHSYVRRRRWLRKRVRKDMRDPSKAIPSSMSAAHKLNTDYFTIHSQPRASSPGRTLDGAPQTARPESYVSYRSHTTLDNEIPEEINDVSSLLKALKSVSVDRQKLDSIRKFVDTGGEELVYLEKYIPEIMSFLVYQNSKRQLLEYLRSEAQKAQDHRSEHDAQKKPEGDEEGRRIDNLLKAADAADEQVRGLEYYSDRKHILKVRDDGEMLKDAPMETIFDRPVSRSQLETNPAEEIKGISKDAELGLDGTNEVARRIQRRTTKEALEDKGKGKAHPQDENGGRDVDSSNQREQSPPRLKPDQVFIPDDDA